MKLFSQTALKLLPSLFLAFGLLFQVRAHGDSPKSADAADPAGVTKALRYTSAFAGYKSLGSDTVGQWHDVNKKVTGGMTSMRGEEMGMGDSESMQGMDGMQGMDSSQSSSHKQVQHNEAKPKAKLKAKLKRPKGKPKKPAMQDDMPMKMK